MGLVVHDYGVGITAENQKHIFEGFFVTRDTMAYSSQRPFDFNAGGKGADLLIDLMNRSQQLFADHDINKIRRDLGENPVSSIWLWGQGRQTRLESFRKRFGLKGAAITAVDLVRGPPT